MSELPDGWKLAPIGSLCNLANGRAFKPTDWTDKGLPIVRIQNLNNPKASFNYFDKEVDDRFLLNGGELLFAWSGTPGTSFGAHVWRGGKAVLNQHIFRVDFDEKSIDKRFFRYAINQKLDELINVAHGGVGLRHVTKGVFENTEVVVPPLPEQKRIADKLDALLARVEQCQTHLDRVPALLKAFRQSVLAAATSGRLTEDWREKQKNSGNYQNAVVQFKNILADRATKIKNEKNPKEHLANEEFDIPDGWIWVSLDALAIQIVDGTHFTPNYIEEGIPFISVKDIRNGKIDFSNTKFISLSEHEELTKRCKPEIGDLLITKSGTIGRTAIVNTNVEFSLFVSVALIKPASQLVNMRFVDIALQNWINHIDISSRIVGSAIKNLHLQDMRVLAIPFPPIEEQHEIVSRVERLFAFGERLEARWRAAQGQVSALTPSLLAKAFCGELVEQDPSDEPAAKLLEKIKAERETTGKVDKPMVKKGKTNVAEKSKRA